MAFDKNLLKHPLVVLVFLFILLAISSNLGLKIPFSVVSQEKGAPLVVSGEGRTYAVPDTAKFTAGVEVSGPRLSEIQKEFNKKTKDLTDELKNRGVAEKDIKTVSYNLFPEYDYQKTPPKITGFRLSTSYEIKTKDIDRVNELLDAASESGANTVGGITFEISEGVKKELFKKARVEAVAEAKERAQGLANASGISLGKIINVSESESGGPTPPIILERSLAEDSQKPVVAPGETEIVISVFLSFEIQ